MSWTVEKTKAYHTWFSRLRDGKARARIVARLFLVEQGNFGDAQPVGEGVSEIRIHYGPGYRIYFTRVGFAVVLLLCGGDKGSQNKDIKMAQRMARELKEKKT